MELVKGVVKVVGQGKNEKTQKEVANGEAEKAREIAKDEGEKVQEVTTHGVKSNPCDMDKDNINDSKSDEEIEEPEESQEPGRPGLSDEEFNKLLDNALSDFLVESSPKGESKAESQPKPVAEPEPQGAVGDSCEIKMEDLEAIYEEIRKMELSDDHDVKPVMETLSKIAEKAESNENGGEVKYIVETVMDVVQNMRQTAQNLQMEDNVPDLVDMMTTDADFDLPPDELAELMVPPEDLARARALNINPFVMRLISMCLSKSVLYPPLKGLVDQFPEWLATHEASLSNAEYKKRVDQLELIKKICAEFENEDPNDSEEVKTEHFKVVMNLMQELKQYGAPPSELLGGIPLPPFQLDMTGMPNIGNLPDDDRCCVM